MAYVIFACSLRTSSTPAITREVASNIAVSAPSHDWLLCCDRKKFSTGYDRWLSNTSADQRSQSWKIRSRTGCSVHFPKRANNSNAVGGEPARASKSEISISRVEKRE